MPFVLPPHVLAERTCWGAVNLPSEVLKECLRDALGFPFSPLLKCEKVGRVCDFTFWTVQRQMAGQRDTKGASAGANYGRGAGLDERNTVGGSDFTLVESFKPQKVQRGYRPAAKRMPGQQGFRGQGQQQGMQHGRPQQYGQQVVRNQRGGPMNMRTQGPMGNRNMQLNAVAQNRWNRQRFIVQELQLELSPSWELIQSIQINTLPSYHVNPNLINFQDVAFHGTLMYYNSKFDRVTPNRPRVLDSKYHGSMTFVGSRTADDRILTEKWETDEKIQVVATDQVLATLMVAPSSRYGWHLTMGRFDGKLLIDKTENSAVDFLTVGECSPEPPQPDDPVRINRIFDLGVEAVKINQDFSQMVLDYSAQPVRTEPPAPFFEQNDKPPTRCYRYRQITLPPGSKVPAAVGPTAVRRQPVTLLVRTEIDCVAPAEAASGKPGPYVSVKALNEGPVKGAESWRTMMDRQKGSLLITEYRNNANKMSKWVAQADLSGAEVLKLGFVVRSSTNENVNHQLLAIQSYNVTDIASQLGVKNSNTWGILRELIDIMLNDIQEDGEYILVRDPSHFQLKLYKLPEGGNSDEKSSVDDGSD